MKNLSTLLLINIKKDTRHLYHEFLRPKKSKSETYKNMFVLLPTNQVNPTPAIQHYIVTEQAKSLLRQVTELTE